MAVAPARGSGRRRRRVGLGLGEPVRARVDRLGLGRHRSAHPAARAGDRLARPRTAVDRHRGRRRAGERLGRAAADRRHRAREHYRDPASGARADGREHDRVRHGARRGRARQLAAGHACVERQLARRRDLSGVQAEHARLRSRAGRDGRIRLHHGRALPALDRLAADLDADPRDDRAHVRLRPPRGRRGEQLGDDRDAKHLGELPAGRAWLQRRGPGGVRPQRSSGLDAGHERARGSRRHAVATLAGAVGARTCS